MQILTRIPNLKVKSESYFFLSLTCPCLQARKLEVEDRQWGSILGALTGGAGGAALGNALGSAAGRNIFFNFPQLNLFPGSALGGDGNLGGAGGALAGALGGGSAGSAAGNALENLVSGR